MVEDLRRLLLAGGWWQFSGSLVEACPDLESGLVGRIQITFHN